LKARGYTDVEIENVFARYDSDGDRVLRDAEQRKFKADLAAQENNLEMDINDLNNSHGAQYTNCKIKQKTIDYHFEFRHNKEDGSTAAATTTSSGATGGNENDPANRITYDEFAILVRRIDRMEYSIGNIVSRVGLRTIFFSFFFIGNQFRSMVF